MLITLIKDTTHVAFFCVSCVCVTFDTKQLIFTMRIRSDYVVFESKLILFGFFFFSLFPSVFTSPSLCVIYKLLSILRSYTQFFVFLLNHFSLRSLFISLSYIGDTQRKYIYIYVLIIT